MAVPYNSMSPTVLIRSLQQNWSLIKQLVWRDVMGRYKGSWLGLAWSVINPAILLLVYTFFFTVVFRARWGEAESTSKAEFAILVFVGLIMHGLFAECANRAPHLIQNHSNYVKKIVFPLETLVVVAHGSALFHLCMNVVVLLIATFLMTGGIPWTVLYLPFILLPLVLTSLGFGWALSSLGVFVRDVGQVTNFMMTVLLFMSPVFYPVSAMPQPFRTWLMLNPLTFIIEQARLVLVAGKSPDFIGVIVATSLGAIIAWIGFAWFQRTRGAFADVI